MLVFTSLLLFSLFVSNTNSSKNVLALSFNFGGPNGFNFDTGGLSSPGEQGPKGDTGDTGATGPEGPKGDTGDTGATGQGIEYGHVIVFVHVTDLTNEGYVASDIPILIKGNNQSPDSFQGSETGTNVKLGFGNYEVGFGNPDNKNPSLPPPLTMHDLSQGCVGVIHPNETKTCTITLTINPQ